MPPLPSLTDDQQHLVSELVDVARQVDPPARFWWGGETADSIESAIILSGSGLRVLTSFAREKLEFFANAGLIIGRDIGAEDAAPMYRFLLLEEAFEYDDHPPGRSLVPPRGSASRWLAPA